MSLFYIIILNICIKLHRPSLLIVYIANDIKEKIILSLLKFKQQINMQMYNLPTLGTGSIKKMHDVVGLDTVPFKYTLQTWLN